MAERQGAAPPLVVDGLTFRYRARPEPAIRDVSFTLEPGELLLVAGTSGCGKTTLIRCINGLIPRSYKGELSGRVLLHGQDTGGMSLSRISQIVGTVLQDPERQILGAHVFTEVAFGLENLGVPRDEIVRRVEETLDYLGISHLRGRETFYLSGGEKQKVALAGVLAMRPSILLLDEPLASLDPASAQEALALFRRLVDEGVSILLVEHRVEDALSIHPDRVLFMEAGRITYSGPVDGLMEVVDHRQVKLPAPVVMQHAAAGPPPVFEPAIQPDGREPLVKFEDVSFAYGDGPEVLHDVSLTIRRGDIIAVLGPNGAGKTTLVKHAIGLLKPRQGRVLVEGRDTREISVAQIAHTLGYVFQSPSHMLFAATVREELAFGPRNLGYGEPEIAAGVEGAIDTVNLRGLEEYPPLALSFGQQKRVSIAAILAMRSKILVMDEPTSGQDYWNYMAFMNGILQMPGFAAVLFITHDLDLAICYANRVILMHEGRIASDGPPAEVLTAPGLLRRCRLVPTSLLEVNLKHLPETGRFMSAEALAHAIAGTPGPSRTQPEAPVL
ncbi:MAG TPA: energy-coupling factor ABC transporter ATP-binding protein [Anaerolineales bacterium]|nr:energy-coupling factor ABC transporter ATP-binding protein [Anaerolineae bacterium]HIQ02385.1 energy-coupling factor ABC transporter ATP-binding protein [Anaerolineales bacterium]